jgi:hypothetical protein
MADFGISLQWQQAEDPDLLTQETSAYMRVNVDGVCLTRCEDVWSHTVREDTLVSAYPLALWLANSWWRLNHEPLPDSPDTVWRQTHELAGAGSGYVWPSILFAPDGENMNVWASPLQVVGQSVSYLGWLNHPAVIPAMQFQNEAQKVVDEVLGRLSALGHAENDLKTVWNLVQSERGDPGLSRRRVLEARLGFDPEECPSAVLDQMFGFQNQTGEEALFELAPVLGHSPQMVSENLVALTKAQGLRGQFKLPDLGNANTFSSPSSMPWQKGNEAARLLRKGLSNTAEPLTDKELLSLVGLATNSIERFVYNRNFTTIVRPSDGDFYDFVLRKPHPLARRFELARLIGDHVMARQPCSGSRWLVSADTATAIQKRQRAFAAEFLCPFDALKEFLGGDLSETAQEAAACHFQVSDKTVETILADHGEIPRPDSPFFPYAA